MARIPKTRGGLARATASAFAAALYLAIGVFPALAQEAEPLRGSLGQSGIEEPSPPADAISDKRTGSISREASAGGSDSYQPVSPGALPDEASAPDTDGAFQRQEGMSPAPRLGAAAERSQGENATASDATGDTLATGAVTVPLEPEDAAAAGRRLNERARPIEARSDRRAEDSPYAPLGLRVGTFVVVPTLEQGLEWTSNADEVPEGGSALLSATTLRLSAASDWSRHAATLDAYGTYRKTISGVEVSDFEGGLKTGLELDFGAGLRGLASLGYTVAPESASSPVEIADVVERPLRHTIDGSVGLAKDAGKLRLGLTGDVSRDQYGSAELAGGGTLSQSDRNSTLLALRLRGGYAVSPAITPFLEGEVGRRLYDEMHDSSGFARSATRLGARAGVALDLREKLTGEASLGWISENPDDARLETISGLAIAANLAWSPVRGTVVRLDGATTVETTTDPGESGSILYSGELSMEREIRANLTSKVLFGAEWREYTADGNDLVLFGEAGLTWWLNRNLGLTGRLRHERLDSTLPDRDYEVSSVFLGMRLQR